MIIQFIPGTGGPIDINAAVITLDSSLTYNGSEQTQTITVTYNNKTLVENTDYVVINNRATNAGQYTMTVTGLGQYNGTKNKSWSIAKAQGSLSASPSSLSIVGAAGTTASSTITVVGDGVLSASSEDEAVATVSVSGNVITVAAVATGETSIVISANSSNYIYSSVSITVECLVASAILAENTPAVIQTIARSGNASQWWSVGDRTAEISIDAMENMSATSCCAFILGFDHNSTIEGTGIHFQLGKTVSGADIALVDTGYGSQKTSGTWYTMGNSSNNYGGWKSSLMRTTTCATFLTKLPSAWQDVIVSTNKYTDNTGGDDAESHVTSTFDKLFLLAEYEAYGFRRYANSAEYKKQQQYDYYKNGNSRVKYKHNDTATACIWWLRSPYVGTNNLFCHIAVDGSVNGSSAERTYGFAPAFRVA